MPVWFLWFTALMLSSHRCIDHTPKLKLWMATMQEDPVASSHFIDAKTYRDYLSLYLQDSPEACDYGL